MPKPLTVWITTNWKILKEMGIPDHVTCLLSLGKDPDWRPEEKQTTEDEMVGWHYRLDGHEFEQAPRVDDR